MQTQTRDRRACHHAKRDTGVQSRPALRGSDGATDATPRLSTFSHRASTVPAWIMATCSSFLKFYNTETGKGV